MPRGESTWSTECLKCSTRSRLYALQLMPWIQMHLLLSHPLPMPRSLPLPSYPQLPPASNLQVLLYQRFNLLFSLPDNTKCLAKVHQRIWLPRQPITTAIAVTLFKRSHIESTLSRSRWDRTMTFWPLVRHPKSSNLPHKHRQCPRDPESGRRREVLHYLRMTTEVAQAPPARLPVGLGDGKIIMIESVTPSMYVI